MYPSFIVSGISVVIALGLINVWVVRSGRATAYRGGSAQTMKEEFAAYGLPAWAVYVVGTLKLSIALVLLARVVAPSMGRLLPTGALLLLVVLMLGALSMHIKVKDPLRKSPPALGMLALTLLALYLG